MLSGSEETRLARAAAAGDGPAFAGLYEAYERRIFNYLLRLLGDRHEAEDATQDAFLRVVTKLPELDLESLQFGPYLYTAARNAGYDVITKRKKLEPTGAVPEQAEAPYRGELQDLETDPERAALAGSQDAAVNSANERLPERQREVLALRELDNLSYDEIAGVMEMKPNAVAQLISRARISLRKEMRAGAAASVAFASVDCERAHGELACRQDGQARGFDDQWLDSHLALCPNCQVASEEMAEAGVSYRAWAPVVPAAWVFREVMARASETTGHDWTGIERPGPDARTAAGDAVASSNASRGRRAGLIGAGAVLVAAVFATLLLAEADAPEAERTVRDALVRQETKPKREVREKAGKRRNRNARENRTKRPVEADGTVVTSTSTNAPDGPPGGNNGRPKPSAPQKPSGSSKPTSPPRQDPDPKPADPVEPVTPPSPDPPPTPPTPDPDPCIPVVGGPSC